MSKRHCTAETCVLDVLSEVFGDEEIGDVAMSATCFPCDCDVASAQARVFVDRIKAGEDKKAVMREVYEAVELAMSKAMDEYDARQGKDTP